jgi:glutathione S-transferase
VPVLVDGETVLWESNTICRYLAASRSRSDLLPADPQGRARVEQWMDWQVAELNRAWSYAFMALVRKSPSHTDAAAIEASIASWHRHMAILDAQLARSSAFVAGATLTLADIVLGLSTQRWFATPIAAAVTARGRGLLRAADRAARLSPAWPQRHALRTAAPPAV